MAKQTLLMESYKNLGIILKEMYANKNFFKNKKNHGRRLFNGRAGMLTN